MADSFAATPITVAILSRSSPTHSIQCAFSFFAILIYRYDCLLFIFAVDKYNFGCKNNLGMIFYIMSKSKEFFSLTRDIADLSRRNISYTDI